MPAAIHGCARAYLIDVAFSALQDPGERDFFNAIGLRRRSRSIAVA